MTTVSTATSFGANVFNLSLKDEARKSTHCNLQPATRNPQPATFKVVLDAGHGGKDPGGMGDNSYEKTIALKITQLLAIGIRTNFPNVEVIMTRSDDTFIPLYERARIANDASADLFISIHANIMPGGTSTYGTETFVMGQHVAEHNLAVAKRENASILLEDNVQKNYGYDPNSDEGHIMMSTFQHAFLERSILFADLVESQFKNAGRKSRGVKQAGFVVLKETTMPAVLVETGFMSNPNEEAYLLSETGQQELANSILKAFAAYYKRLVGSQEGNSVAATSAPRNAKASAARPTFPLLTKSPSVDVLSKEVPASTPPTAARRSQWSARGGAPSPIVYQSPLPVSAKSLPVPPASGNNAPLPVTYGTPVSVQAQPQPVAPRDEQLSSLLSREVTNSLNTQPAVYERTRRAPAPVAIQPPSDSTPYTFKKAKQVAAPPPPPSLDLESIPDQKLLYAVQLIATEREIDLTSAQWQRVPYPIRKVREGRWNKYQIRGLATAQEAKAAKQKAKDAGVNEAMVVVYYNNKRLSPSSVRYLLGR